MEIIEYFYDNIFQMKSFKEYVIHAPDGLHTFKTFEEAASFMDNLNNTKRFDSKIKGMLND